MNAARPRPNRAGFTLLELLIASALTATLMVLVWSLFGVYTKLSDRGVEQAAELQLVRALVRQFRADLRHALPQPLQPSVTNSALSLSPSTAPGPVSASSAALLPDGPALVGTRTTLQFLTWSAREPEPPRETAPETNLPVSPPVVFDLVSYHWEGIDPLTASLGGMTPSAGGTSPAGSSLDTRDANEFPVNGDRNVEPENLAGLTRSVRPWHQQLALPTAILADRETPPTRTPEPADARESASAPPSDFVPEVSRLRFRYFDGRAWRSRWDSRQQKKLPAAIEIAFELEDPEKRQRDLMKNLDASGSKLPLSDPAEIADRPESEPDSPRAAGFEPENQAEPPYAEYRFVIALDSGLASLPKPGTAIP